MGGVEWYDHGWYWVVRPWVVLGGTTMGGIGWYDHG